LLKASSFGKPVVGSSLLEQLTQNAMSLHRLLLDPRPSKTHEKKLPIRKEDLKTCFADLLFPGLLEDKPGVFFELLNAMAHERRLFKGEQKIDGVCLSVAMKKVTRPSCTKSVSVEPPPPQTAVLRANLQLSSRGAEAQKANDSIKLSLRKRRRAEMLCAVCPL
jgi:hypothetical protein